MNTRVRTTLAVVAAAVGIVGAPAVAGASPNGAASGTGCPTIGEAWSAWAQLGPGYEAAIGPWTSGVARSTSVGGTDYEDEVDDGVGVIARVIGFYCE